MFNDSDALYQLLPAYIRFRDQKAGGPLQQLLSIPGAQAVALQRDLDRMYDGWFIETCDESLIPYVGELVGIPPGSTVTGPAALSARAATANAIAQRRRKGTLWILEEIARDQAHWPARAIELYRQLVTTVHPDHIYPKRLATADIRSAQRLEDLNGPFDDFCHLNDVRRISNEGSRGFYSIPNVGLFVWRLRPYSVSATSAYCHEEIGSNCFSFSALGNDTQLFQNPEEETERSAIAQAENLPVPITRLALEWNATSDARRAQADPALYGEGRSLWIGVDGWGKQKGVKTIAASDIIPADLSEWTYKVPKDHVAVDPVLGRIAFAPSQAPRRGVKVIYRYGFAMDIGGGEYRRPATPLPPEVERLQVRVGADPKKDSAAFPNIADAFAHWRVRRDAGRATADETAESSEDGAVASESESATADERKIPPAALVIELVASGVYKGRFELILREGETVVVQAAPETRPVIWLADENSEGSDAISIRGSQGSRLILDGLLIAGRAVEMANAEPTQEVTDRVRAGELCEVWIRHCTLVPGNSLHPNCEPRHPSEPSIVVDQTSACLRIESSITGAIRVIAADPLREPGNIVIRDSIVDATSETRSAIGGPGHDLAYSNLNVWRSTVVGRIAVHVFEYGEDSILVSRVDVARRQTGCIRFCYVTTDSRTPRKYECQPADTASNVGPRLESTRYGSPVYMRLTPCTPNEIRRGAHDQSEMGVYHDLYEPQRLAMLTARLQESIPASCNAAVVFAS